MTTPANPPHTKPPTFPASIEVVAIESVHPDPANARTHPPRNLAVLKGSLARFGQVKPIVVTKDNVIRAGNGLWQAAKEMGWTQVAIVRSELTGSEAVGFALTDNQSALLSEWNDDILAAQLSGLHEDGWRPQDLEGLGWNIDDLKALDTDVDLSGLLGSEGWGAGGGGGAGGKVIEDEPPAVQEKAVSRTGDLWLLGAYYQCDCGEIHELP